jgi:hypothetical protein
VGLFNPPWHSSKFWCQVEKESLDSHRLKTLHVLILPTRVVLKVSTNIALNIDKIVVKLTRTLLPDSTSKFLPAALAAALPKKLVGAGGAEGASC